LSENGNPGVVTVNRRHEETSGSVLLKGPPQQTSFSEKWYGGISLGGDIQESKQKFLTLAEKKNFSLKFLRSAVNSYQYSFSLNGRQC
jgi:hypothetical protein